MSTADASCQPAFAVAYLPGTSGALPVENVTHTGTTLQSKTHLVGKSLYLCVCARAGARACCVLRTCLDVYVSPLNALTSARYTSDLSPEQRLIPPYNNLTGTIYLIY